MRCGIKLVTLAISPAPFAATSRQRAMRNKICNEKRTATKKIFESEHGKGTLAEMKNQIKLSFWKPALPQARESFFNLARSF
jgi:hypothetical protein